MNIPENLSYTNTHEWVKIDGDIITLGITDHAQKELGDIIFLELPEVGSKLEIGGEFSTIEAVKTVAILYSPCLGEVVEVNTILEDEAEIINKSPYEKGWIAKIKFTTLGENSLLDFKGYLAHIGQ